MRSRRRKGRVESAGPDLVPVMNLACMLIPLMLMGAHFSQLSIVETTLPAI